MLWVLELSQQGGSFEQPQQRFELIVIYYHNFKLTFLSVDLHQTFQGQNYSPIYFSTSFSFLN